MIEPNDTTPLQSAADRIAAFLALIRPLLVEQEFPLAASEFLSRLTQVTACDRASLGFVDGHTVKVCAVSRHYQDMVDAVLPEVAAAMEESVLQDSLLAYPHSLSDFPYIVVAHADLARRNNLSNVLTVPLARQGVLIGAITLENCKTDASDFDQIWLLKKLASDIGPLLYLKWSLQRPLWVRLLSMLRPNPFAESDSRPRQIRIAGTALAMLCAVMFFIIPFPNKISGQARLEASVQRLITAPIDGYLKEVRVRPGDRVRANQLLAVLDEDTLLAQRRKVEAEAAQLENSLAEAMVKADRTQVAIRSAKLDEVVAQRDLIDNQLSQTRLIAPFDGVVIKGDLTQMLGSPLKRSDTLLTLSKGDGFRVIVEVDERDISDIRAGQDGTLVLAALPSETFRIRTLRMTPVANVTPEGKNVFEVEAAVESGRIASLAPGLKGVAKITTGSEPVGWKWIAGVWHALVYAIWSRLG